MPRKIEVQNQERIITEIRSHLFIGDQARFLGRLYVMLLICHGIPVRQLAGIFQLSPTTIQRWVHRLNIQGVNGLRDRPGPGRPSAISDEARHQLSLDLAQAPGVFGHARKEWSGRLLSCHLKDRFGICLKLRQCQNLLRSLKAVNR